MTATREGTDLQTGAAGSQEIQKEKRLPGFCQLASVIKVKGAEAPVRNIIFDSSVHP